MMWQYFVQYILDYNAKSDMTRFDHLMLFFLSFLSCLYLIKKTNSSVSRIISKMALYLMLNAKYCYIDHSTLTVNGNTRVPHVAHTPHHVPNMAHVKLKNFLLQLTVMRQHDKLETVLRHFLVEDRGVDGSTSYVDFLCHIHKEIRTLL